MAVPDYLHPWNKQERHGCPTFLRILCRPSGYRKCSSVPWSASTNRTLHSAFLTANSSSPKGISSSDTRPGRTKRSLPPPRATEFDPSYSPQILPSTASPISWGANSAAYISDAHWSVVRLSSLRSPRMSRIAASRAATRRAWSGGARISGSTPVPSQSVPVTGSVVL